MRPKSLILLVLALGCGLVASIGISQVMDRRDSPSATLETEAIYVAKVDINLSDRITSDLVKLDERVKAKLPKGVVKNVDDLLERRPRTKIYAGEPILEKKLRAKNAVDDPSQQIPMGFRVVPVSVKKDSNGGGLIVPGDRVDVQLFVKRRAGVAQTMVKTVLTNIRVFAVNTRIRREVDSDDERVKASVVSLLVTPEQADKLTLATKLGSIKMIIRNPDDDSVVEDNGATISDIFGSLAGNRTRERVSFEAPRSNSSLDWLARLKEAAMVGAADRPPWTVEILTGPERSEVIFDANGQQIHGPWKPFSLKPPSAPAAPSDHESEADDAAAVSDGNAAESDATDDGVVTEDDLILPEEPLEEE